MQRSRFLVGLAWLALAVPACSLIADSSLRAGIGVPCGSDDECQAGVCDHGLCATTCAQDSDCPAPSLCLDARCRVACRVDGDCPTGEVCANAECMASLKIVALVPGGIDGEDGFSTAQKLALDEATSAQPYTRFQEKPYVLRDALRGAAQMRQAMDQAIAQGAQVVVTTAGVGATEALGEAPTHEGVRFLIAGTTGSGGRDNVGAYDSRTEQGWYAAGRLAARVAGGANRCIGMILPTPTKRIVRETNAFVRGASFQEPDVKVVIRWVGATRDPHESPPYSYGAQSYDFHSDALYREELLAAQIADLGCTVIAHRTETQRVVGIVEKSLQVPFRDNGARPQLFSMGVDLRDACKANAAPDGDWLQSCFGVVYASYGPLYSKLLDEIHRGTWVPGDDLEPFHADPTGLLQFAPSPRYTITGVGVDDADQVLQDAANLGFDAVFEGPYSFTGQRDRDRDGLPDADQSVALHEKLSDDELSRMCWFVQGAWELPDPSVVAFASLVPALVPYGPPVSGQSTTLDSANAADVKKYGDVIQFVRDIGGDPAVAMSCALD